MKMATDMTTSFVPKNDSLLHDSKFFCPPGSDIVCPLSQLCYNGQCLEDPNLQTFMWVVIGIILMLILANIAVGYKAYRRWQNKKEKEELEGLGSLSNKSSEEDKLTSKKGNKYLDAIRIKPVKQGVGSSIGSSIGAASSSVH